MPGKVEWLMFICQLFSALKPFSCTLHLYLHCRASSRTVNSVVFVCTAQAKKQLQKKSDFTSLCIQQKLRGVVNLCTKQLCCYTFNAVCKNSFFPLFISCSKEISIAAKQPSLWLICHLASSVTDESSNLDLPQACVCSTELSDEMWA